jgi:hypothetical protein
MFLVKKLNDLSQLKCGKFTGHNQTVTPIMAAATHDIIETSASVEADIAAAPVVAAAAPASSEGPHHHHWEGTVWTVGLNLENTGYNVLRRLFNEWDVANGCACFIQKTKLIYAI